MHHLMAAQADRGLQGTGVSDQCATKAARPLSWLDTGDVDDVELGAERPLTDSHRCLELTTLWQDRVLDVRHIEVGRAVFIGETPASDVLVTAEGMPTACLPLVRWLQGEATITLFPGLVGHVERASAVVPLGQLSGVADADLAGCARVALRPGELYHLEHAGVTLRLRLAPPPMALPRTLGRNVNYSFLNVLLVSMFAHTLFFGAVALEPPGPRHLDADLLSAPNRFSQFLLQPRAPVPSMLERITAPGAASPRAALDEGEAGQRHAPVRPTRMANRGDPPTGEVVLRAVTRVFDSVSRHGGGRNALGSTLGGELASALGHVTGTTVGDARGKLGLGTRGNGPGGGGASSTTYGAGDIKTRGRGTGDGEVGTGGGALRPRKVRDPVVTSGPMQMSGSLDKGLIRRVIREHVAEVRYCYETELQRSPGLHGKVSILFIINGSGRVRNASVAETTLRSAAVESCLQGKVRRWIFPKPRGGGIVVVTYPFIFKQSG